MNDYYIPRGISESVATSDLITTLQLYRHHKVQMVTTTATTHEHTKCYERDDDNDPIPELVAAVTF